MSGIPDPVLFGGDAEEGIVAADLSVRKGGEDRIVLFCRKGSETLRREEDFRPFVLADGARLAGTAAAPETLPFSADVEYLDGEAPLNVLLRFRTWKECREAARWLSRSAGCASGDPGAPFLFIGDPVRQYLTASGKTMFKGMDFEQLRRMQIDIECVTGEGYEFCNAERESDEIVAVGMADQTGWTDVLTRDRMSEKELLEALVATVRERDPDVIEGHNIFNFDLPYIAARAKRHGVKLALGRSGGVPAARSSRLAMGERVIAYSRFDVAGRHIVDTLFLVQAYDLSERSLDSFGLKDVAAHFGVTAADRTYVAGDRVTEEYARHPDRLARYVRDDVIETRAVGSILSRSYFVQAGMLPFSYQDVCVRGNATKIDALILREYLRSKRSVPLPDRPRKFSGGLAAVFMRGVARNVRHCDVRSLYPSLMIEKAICPGKDSLGVFLRTLRLLRERRLDARKRSIESGTGIERNRWDAVQRTFKILINSFYGYLGFAQGQFSDFDAAERVAFEGREVLRSMVETLRRKGAFPIEIDTDGIYFVPPSTDEKGLERFMREVTASLPKGIEVEFDGRYAAMYSYKIKNYALLAEDGRMIMKGAALKSRGQERFLRSFLAEAVRLRLEGKEKQIAALGEKYKTALVRHELPLTELARTVTLQDSPSAYASRIGEKSRGRDAAYELAMKSARPYRAGDRLTFYVTGSKKNVAVHEHAKLVSAADPSVRDENVPYYLAKLDALCKKLQDDGESVDAQESLGL